MRVPAGDSRRRLALAAGGTGGHIFPAVALAAEMEGRGWQTDFLTDRRGVRYLDGLPPRNGLLVLPALSPSRGPVLERLASPFAMGWWSLRLWGLFRQWRPAGLVAFGGYAAVPALLAAVLARMPCILHEQNARLGRVNRLFVRRGMQLACGLTRPPEASADAEVTGNPMAAEFGPYVGHPYRAPTDGETIQLFVTGGSQGSRSVASLSAGALGLLPEDLRRRLEVTLQAREEDTGRVRGMLEACGVRHQVAPFFREVPRRLADCHLVIGRAGASTLAEISAVGRPSILIPLPSAMDDHQSANARVLAEAGAALTFAETGGGGTEALAGEIEGLLRNRERLQGMAAAALRVSHPRATQALADLVERHAGAGA